jgi:phage-related protein
MAKRLVWLGSSRRDIRGFPGPARRAAGFQLFRVQQGLEPNDWKPMASIGAGVQEIRIHTETEHPSDIELARNRYRELLEHRRREDHGKS